MAYIGQSIKNGTFSVLDTSGNTYNGSNTAFALGTQVGSAAQLLVSHDGVIQKPGTDYTLSSGGAAITFTTAPASGASIFIVEISGAVGGPMNRDINGEELILDVDGDSSITADTDDQIDIKIGGSDIISATASAFTVNSGVVFNENSASVDFRVESNGDENCLIVDGSGDRVGIGIAVPEAKLHIFDGDASVGPNANGDELVVEDNDNCGISILSSNDAYGSIFFGDSGDDDIGQIRYDHTNNNMSFIANAAEAMRINNAGALLIGKTTAGSSVQGIEAAAPNGDLAATRTDALPFLVNRLGNDGELILLRHANSTEGTISVSGSTVSYGGFTGTHWSRLADNSKPTILKGTILESLDAMVDWYQIKFTVTDKESKDENGDFKTYEFKEDYALKDGESVGDVITHTHDGVDLPATIEKEQDIKHAQCKVSNSAESKSVYGAFVAWDNDSTDTVNDILVAQVGTFVIRVHKDETVAKGDLIQSKGDGTGKVQADDIIRASTVAKVLSTTKIETYSDGSYIVPCSLHC